jgi:hypothetical protein
MLRCIVPELDGYSTVRQHNAHAPLKDAPQALSLSVLRAAIRYCEPTLDHKFFAELIDRIGGELAPIVCEPLADNTIR